MNRILKLIVCIMCLQLVINVVPAASFAQTNEIIVNTDDETAFKVGGKFIISSLKGYNDVLTYYSQEAGGAAKYIPKIDTGGVYKVYIYQFGTAGLNPQNYEVYHNGKSDFIPVNCNTSNVGWFEIGEFDFIGDGSENVRIVSTQGNFTRISAVKFELIENSTAVPNPNPEIQEPDYILDDGPSVWTAKYVAQSITIIPKPLRYDNKLSLLKEFDGFDISIGSTNPEGIIDNEWNITRPSSDTEVEVTLNITNKNDADDTATKTLTVPIDKAYSKPDFDSEIFETKQLEYQRKKHGIFVHYVPNLTKDVNGNVIKDIDDLANGFDAKQFADDMELFGVEYVVFTASHANQLLLYPSEVSKRWRDDRRKQTGVKTYSERDLIGDLADTLKEKGIELYLYEHPVDGHDFSAEDQKLTGFLDETNHFEIWNTFQNELFDEMCERYKDKIAGMWFDGKFINWSMGDKPLIQHERFKETLTAYNPYLITIANVSKDRTWDPFPEWTSVDYRAWEVSNVTSSVLGFSSVNPNVSNSDAKTWPATKHQLAIITGSSWWATNKKASAPYSAENLFLYTVAQASVSKSGGVLYSAGCFPVTSQQPQSGGIWENGFYNEMIKLKALIEPIRESIVNTYAGKAYVTADHEWIAQKEWGVSTESADRKYIYLHILNKPSGKTISIPNTQDGSVLSSDAVILNNNIPVELIKTNDGYELTLPENCEWDELDTVIKVKRDAHILIENNKIMVNGVTNDSILTVAGYKSNEVLDSVKIQTINSDTVIDLEELNMSTDNIKVFLWDNMDKMTPLALCAE